MGIDYVLCCDNADQEQLLKYNHGVPADKIVVLNTPVEELTKMSAIAWIRDKIAKEIMPQGQWSIWIDDNVSDFTCLPNPLMFGNKIDYFNDQLTVSGEPVSWREAFKHVATKDEFARVLENTITEAEDHGTIFAGFAIETNPMFRCNKWQRFGYARTQFALYKNDGSSWYPKEFRDGTCVFEDMYKSIDVVCRYGSIVINRYAKPLKIPFEAGGIGTFKEREPFLIKNCQTLMKMYPGLLSFVRDTDYQVTFAKRSINTVNIWRRENGFCD